MVLSSAAKNPPLYACFPRLLSEGWPLKISENGATPPLKRKLGVTSRLGSYPEQQISMVSEGFLLCERLCLYSNVSVSGTVAIMLGADH